MGIRKDLPSTVGNSNALACLDPHRQSDRCKGGSISSIRCSGFDAVTLLRAWQVILPVSTVFFDAEVFDEAL